MGAGGLRAWVPFAVLLPLTVARDVWLGRIRVAVTADEFQVDDARLPVSVIADVVALDADGKREVLGVGAHPLAFVVQRPWISGRGPGRARRSGRPDAVLGGQHPAPGRAGDRAARREGLAAAKRQEPSALRSVPSARCFLRRSFCTFSPSFRVARRFR